LAPSGTLRLPERSILAAGALALAASSFLPLLAPWTFPCRGWTCYSPLLPGERPPAPPRPISGTTLWDTRPSLAVLTLAAAALAVLVGMTVRDLRARRVAAAALVLTVGLLVGDTAHFSGDVIRHHRTLYTSAWLALPVAGGLIAALALALGDERQRGT
jgi:hypothetical protein